VFGAGTLHWPEVLSSHAAIESSALSPRLWALPAATATKPVFGSGTLHCP
jgi:hypothetical protein